jgi:hypothetical protein
MTEERHDDETQADRERINDFQQKFRNEGLEIDFDRARDGTWSAAVRRIDSTFGTAPYGVGATRADAIEAAWAQHTHTRPGSIPPGG